jgi:hypothetical protein
MLAPTREKRHRFFAAPPVRSSKASKRLSMMKASIRNMVLGIGCLTATISVARAAEPEAAPPVGLAPRREPAAAPAAPVVAAAPTGRAAEFPGPWSLHAAVVGSRGAQDPDPWIIGGFIGAAWTHEWFRAGVEVGWDHSVVRHVDSGGVLTTVNYDATPFRLVLAAQNSAVTAGVRAGVAGYRLTAQQNYWEVTPLVGPFLGFHIPIAGRFRGVLQAGFDYFGRRTQLSGRGPGDASGSRGDGGPETLYSSPQLAPYLALVLEAGLGQ